MESTVRSVKGVLSKLSTTHKRHPRTPSPTLSVEEIRSPSPNLSPRKRRRRDTDTLLKQDDIAFTVPISDMDPRQSPTVSDFAIHSVNTEGTGSSSTRVLSQPAEHRNEQKVLGFQPPLLSFQLSPTPSLPELSSATSVNHSRQACGFSDPRYYKPTVPEIEEDEHLVVQGETLSDEFSDDSEDDEVPVRVLDIYTLYKISTKELVYIDELLSIDSNPSKDIAASGLVRAWFDEDDDDDSSQNGDIEPILGPGQPVRLSPVLECNTYHYSDRSDTIDRRVYIRTNFAWYILDTPSPLYNPFCRCFYIKHQLTCLILSSCILDQNTTYKDFLLTLKEANTDDSNIHKLVGRDLERDDLLDDDFLRYLLNAIGCLPRRIARRIEKGPLLHSLTNRTQETIPFNSSEASFSIGAASSESGSEGTGAEENDDSGESDNEDSCSSTRGDPHKRRAKSNKVFSNPELEVLKHRANTVVTPIVASLAQSLFTRHLDVTGEVMGRETDERIIAQIDDAQEHHLDPEVMRWGQIVFSDGNTRFYDSVTLDGVVYKVGDVVMVAPGEDENRKREENHISAAARSPNSYGNRLWFCRICYFFEEEGTKMFHGQWFVHGSKTMLQELAHSKSLYLLNDCENNEVASIFKRCQLRLLAPGEEEPPDDLDPDSNDFHCGLLWDEDNTDFLDLPRQIDVVNALRALPPYKPCYSCGIRAQANVQAELRRIPDGFTQHGVRYHSGDCVYIRPRHNQGNLLRLGQIIKIQGVPQDPRISIQPFKRFNELSADIMEGCVPVSGLIDDNRCLVLQGEIYQVHPDDIDGICYVRHLIDKDTVEQWVKFDDHFYISHAVRHDALLLLYEDSFRPCSTCLEHHMQQVQRTDELLRRHGPLPALELFSGAGGLSTGMEMSGFVETRWAVEFSKSAADSYRRNHPSTAVYREDTNDFLKRAVETHSEQRSQPSPSKKDPHIPGKDEVAFIFGGAPCQSFSMINHQRTPDDIRSTLVCNMLSYVEFYRPTYFLVENVTGLLHYPLLARKGKNGGLEGGIKMGVVKLIQRTLISLGYQVRHKVLQAGQYGAPQHRARVIFWGARRGVQIPDFPIPVYAWPKSPVFYNQPIGIRLSPVTRSKVPKECEDDYHGFAPLRPVTVDDATGDLPPFDWDNPNTIMPETSSSRREARKRINELGIPSFDAVTGEGPCPGFPIPAPYRCAPINRYQLWMRTATMAGVDTRNHNNKHSALVRGHYTSRFKDEIVERTVNIPLHPFADFRDLPDELRLRHKERTRHSYYGRMDGRKFFRTAMTTLRPDFKNTYPLHPSQKRIITIRECARAQGFPDYYQFVSVNNRVKPIINDQNRQIGNAVPIPLALALGKSLGDAVIKDWELDEREGSPTV